MPVRNVCPVCDYAWQEGVNAQHSCVKKLRERVRALESDLADERARLVCWRDFGERCQSINAIELGDLPSEVIPAALAVQSDRELLEEIRLRLRDEAGIAARAAILAMAETISQTAEMKRMSPIRKGLITATLAMRGWANTVGLQASVRRKWAFLHKHERRAYKKD